MSSRKGGRRVAPALSPDGRENQLIALASDLAEKQLREGSAPAQVITHFLKLGTSRERLEQQRLKQENLLISAKVEAMASQKRVEDLYEEAMSAFRQYSGQDTDRYDG